MSDEDEFIRLESPEAVVIHVFELRDCDSLTYVGSLDAGPSGDVIGSVYDADRECIDEFRRNAWKQGYKKRGEQLERINDIDGRSWREMLRFDIKDAAGEGRIEFGAVLL